MSSTASTVTRTLANVRLLVNGSQVGTTVSSLVADGAANSGWGTFGNSFVIKAGTSATLSVIADTTASATDANDTFIVGLSAGSGNAQGVVSLGSISSVAQNGNTLTVKAGTVTVAKNVSLGDKSSANPTGTINASGVKVASFTITAGSGEDVDVSQITLRDNTTSDCVGDYLQNVALKNASGVQLGATVANPSGTCTTQNSFVFNLSPAIKVSSGAQYVVDVFADLKASLTTATSLFDINTVTASGRLTGSTATADSQNLSLQNQYIAASGNLMVQVDSDTAVANNYLMGAADQDIAKFKITASSTEAVSITQLVLSSRISTGATGTVSNIRLVDTATGSQVGSAVPSFGDNSTTATSTYTHAIFSGLSLTIPKGTSRVLAVRVDFTTYENGGFAITGQTVSPLILASYYGQSGNSPITATGASSGTALTALISNDGSSWGSAPHGGSNRTAAAPTSTLYRAKLSIAWAGDAPAGSASPSTAQTVAKFVVSNASNSGAYAATVNRINLNFSTTVSAAAGVDSTRALTIYKDSLSTTALATTNFAVSQKLDGSRAGSAAETITGITNANFNSNNGVDIASGASKTFYATLDTTDSASTKSLSVRVPSSGVVWTDGVTASLTSMGTDLPLSFKTFTY